MKPASQLAGLPCVSPSSFQPCLNPPKINLPLLLVKGLRGKTAIRRCTRFPMQRQVPLTGFSNRQQ